MQNYRYSESSIRVRMEGAKEPLIERFLELRARVWVISQGDKELVPYSCVRSVIDQAKLWRQRQSAFTISRHIKMLQEAGAHYIADCIAAVGPQYGTTYAASPGNSWHQYGEAVDFYILKPNGTADWTWQSYKNIHNNFVEKNSGLYGVGDHDLNHLQITAAHSPRELLSWQTINTLCKRRFS